MSNELVESELQENKRIIEEAYLVTKNKYDKESASNALMKFFMDGFVKGFTRDMGVRDKMTELQYKPYALDHVLFDYAISSFLLNDMKCNIGEQDLYAYIRDNIENLDYSKEKAVSIFAIAISMSLYWAYNLLCCNVKLKKSLVESFIEERFINDLGVQLDQTKRLKYIKLVGEERPLLMSKDSLNNDIRNMINDEGDLSFGGR